MEFISHLINIITQMEAEWFAYYDSRAELLADLDKLMDDLQEFENVIDFVVRKSAVGDRLLLKCEINSSEYIDADDISLRITRITGDHYDGFCIKDD